MVSECQSINVGSAWLSMARPPGSEEAKEAKEEEGTEQPPLFLHSGFTSQSCAISCVQAFNTRTCMEQFKIKTLYLSNTSQFTQELLKEKLKI